MAKVKLETLCFRCNEETANKIRKRADEMGLSLYSYLKQQALSREPLTQAAEDYIRDIARGVAEQFGGEPDINFAKTMILNDATAGYLAHFHEEGIDSLGARPFLFFKQGKPLSPEEQQDAMINRRVEEIRRRKKELEEWKTYANACRKQSEDWQALTMEVVRESTKDNPNMEAIANRFNLKAIPEPAEEEPTSPAEPEPDAIKNRYNPPKMAKVKS